MPTALLLLAVPSGPGMLFDVLAQDGQVERPTHAKSTEKRPTPLRERQTVQVEVHRGSSTGQSARGVR